MKLFCFPYAGGSSAIFNKWKSFINEDIEIVAVELAGRGKRIQETHYGNFKEVVEDVFSIIKNDIECYDYSFFGHSMGAKIAYELAQKILRNGIKGPEHIFFSGRGAPYVPGKDEKEYHKLPDEEFKKEILNLGGTPKEFFEHPELLEVFLPLLKNDFKLATREIAGVEINPLPCDITVLLGNDEELLPKQVDNWKKHTNKNCSIHFYNGDHFFINEKVEDIVSKINNTLQSIPKEI